MTAEAACRTLHPLLETYVDGELSPDKVVEVEQHAGDCRLCSERIRLMCACRQSTRAVVRRSIHVSDALRARVLVVLAAEQQREAEQELRRTPGRPLGWQTIAPIAIAAGFALVFGALKSRDTGIELPSHARANHDGARRDANSYAEANVDQLIEQLLDYHASSGTPDVTEPSLVQGFEPQVGVPVRLPSLRGYGAHWEGGSVVPVRNRHAASLRYRLNGHRLTVYVYDAARFPLRDRLEPSVVHNAPVFVGTRRGYSIAAVERRGVGYALATDLEQRKSAELVASIH